MNAIGKTSAADVISETKSVGFPLEKLIGDYLPRYWISIVPSGEFNHHYCNGCQHFVPRSYCYLFGPSHKVYMKTLKKYDLYLRSWDLNVLIVADVFNVSAKTELSIELTSVEDTGGEIAYRSIVSHVIYALNGITCVYNGKILLSAGIMSDILDFFLHAERVSTGTGTYAGTNASTSAGTGTHIERNRREIPVALSMPARVGTQALTSRDIITHEIEKLIMLQMHGEVIFDCKSVNSGVSGVSGVRSMNLLIDYNKTLSLTSKDYSTLYIKTDTGIFMELFRLDYDSINNEIDNLFLYQTSYDEYKAACCGDVSRSVPLQKCRRVMAPEEIAARKVLLIFPATSLPNPLTICFFPTDKFFLYQTYTLKYNPNWCRVNVEIEQFRRTIWEFSQLRTSKLNIRD
jgi:hypothetical protein